MLKETAKGENLKAVSSNGNCENSSKENDLKDQSFQQNNLQEYYQNVGIIASLKSLPKGIFAVSLFGFFLGMSTTMVYSQLSLFLANELHATVTKVAFIDGIVEFLSFLTRVFSGYISDLLRERKLILLLGCMITLVARPLMSMAHSAMIILGIQSLERVGNGLQATPRDALIADLSPKNMRARAFGFTRSLKTFGALIGTPIAIAIMAISSNNFRLVFLLAVVPVIFAIICLVSIKDSRKNDQQNPNQETKQKRENPFKHKYLKSLDWAFWKVLVLAIIFEMGHFTEHLLPLYMNKFAATKISSTTSLFISLGQVILAFPVGYLADKYGRGLFIKFCMCLMIMANLLFLSAGFVDGGQMLLIIAGSFLWGGQMTAIQGLFLSLISEQVHFNLRATAMGVYYCAIGIAYLVASCVGGQIWDSFGCSYIFVYSICFSCFALCACKFCLPKRMCERVMVQS